MILVQFINLLDDCLELKELIEKETGFALTFEGIHKWIAFVHSKQNDILPVPNRYFGVYEDGTLKIRGTEARRHDTPIFFRKFQQEVLQIMSGGNNIEEVKSLLPKVVDMYHKYVELLKENKVPLDELAFTKWLSKASIEASRTKEGRKAIEDYANSDSEIPPDLSDLISQVKNPEEEIQTATANELAQLGDTRDPLDYGEAQSVEQILANTSILESTNVDEEAMQFYLTYSIDELWKCVFRDEDGTANKTKLEGKNGNKYHDTVVEIFLSEYEGSKRLKVPGGYAFPYPPTLMQSYVAYKVKNNLSYGILL